MDKEHANLINKHFEFIVNNCQCDILLPCLNGRIAVTPDEYAELKAIKDPKSLSREVISFLLHRGPNAFDAFLNALHETDQQNVLNLLAPHFAEINDHLVPNQNHVEIRNNEHQSKHNKKVFQAPKYEQNEIAHVNVTAQEEPLEIVVKHSTNFDYEIKANRDEIPFYNTTSKNRGLVKIINVFDVKGKIPRRGSHLDVKQLQSLFEQIGFIVDVTDNNPTANEIMQQVCAFVRDKRLDKADIAMLFIMSHGGRLIIRNKVEYEGHEGIVEYIQGSDGEILKTRDIEKQFSNENCAYMQGKPKLLLYQACRGDYPDRGVSRRIETDGHVYNNTNIGETTDLIIAHSTAPDTASHRDIYVGTWFIYLICEVFMNHAHDKDIESMLSMVYNKLRNQMTSDGSLQTGEYLVKTFRKCYLNPGIYRQNDQIFEFDFK